VAADGGLREVQRLGGAVVAAKADNREEGAQVSGIEVHRAIVAGTAPARKGPIMDPNRLGGDIGLLPRVPAGRLGCMPDRVVLPAFVLLWSSGYVVGAVALEAADPLPLLAARFALAALLAVPLALRRGRWRGAPLGKLAVIGLLLQVVQFGCVYGGLSLGVPAALSALVILGLSPLATTGLAIATGQEHSDKRLWIGLGIGVAGVALSLAPELTTAQVTAGVGLTLLGMVGLVGGTVLQKRWVGLADPSVSVAVQSVAAALALAPLAVVFGGRFDVGPRLILSLAWVAWGMGVLSLNVFVGVLRRHPASTAAALLLLVPPVTAIASVPALGQALHPASLLGMLVAMVGVAAVLRRQPPTREDAAHARAERPVGPGAGRARGRAGGRPRPRPAD
jgi:drug/metabolite transporter (DMT)-like permease